MKSHLILLSILLSFSAFSQNTSGGSKEKGSSRFEMGVNFSPDLCYRTLILNSTDSIFPRIFEGRNHSESPKLGYSTGLTGVYYIKKNMNLTFGFCFSDNGYQTDWEKMYFINAGNPVIVEFPNDTSKDLSRLKINNRFLYLDFPVCINYSFLKKKLQFVSSFGISINLFLKEIQTFVFKYQDGSIDRSRKGIMYQYESVNISPFIGFGVKYRFNEAFSFSAEPVFRYGVLKIINYEPLSAYLWNVGLNIGFNYRF